ncbi:DUF305 domain-containing protein [Phreatobacter sp.]|uniref:CopM family metallochaperone n=1 Tax=Phreatobacter sp. TaxID=1966341 RepID=UPI0022BFFB4D|nr:DUF305 domain-containing protein [Phreatobacter sp.]MCZ8316463.1 DUF305 domain-containing protein [Phreatobacter sp.]
MRRTAIPALVLAFAAGLAAATALTGGGLPLLAQTHGHGSHGARSPAPAAASAATTGYRAANARMHRDMDIAFTGDADVDFVRGMIPHHQGAIDMAKVVLAHGTDPQVRKWAEDVIREQEREIGEMRGWLARRGR